MASVHTSEESANDVQTIVAESAVQQLLDALDDADCRAILDATREQALTVKEVSEAHDLPLSTTYRKLDLLTEAGLLEERTRIRQSGKHANEYARLVDDVVISLGPRGETEVRVSQRKSPEQAVSFISVIGD
ncbi:helix-turn-helix domain-containing protein [Halomicroarcula sp. F27]|uniref:Helix-turn-helix domain-containing protein n=2 Tax=Haloarcula nitratireducens TaxID=2487749 RepID=A0AAW4PJL4_9EURY|nr:helix-turn-helix domain-containing protein [Halomicroarcula nitratireducens]